MKVCICGIKGKMGSSIYNKLKDDHEIIGIDRQKENLVYDNYKECFCENDIDILIDFSQNDFAYSVIKEALQRKIKVITGTTGIKSKELKELISIAKKNNTSFISSFNYSEGINSFYNEIKKFKKKYPNILLTEAHHINKLDKPSGTAKIIAKYLKIEEKDIKCIRKDNQNAYHEVTFYNDFEKIKISHEVLDYNVFINGFLITFNEILGSKIIIKYMK